MNYIGQRIEIRYDPACPDCVHIFENNACTYTPKPVSLSDNAHAKRNKNVDPDDNFSFSDVFSQNEDDYPCTELFTPSQKSLFQRSCLLMMLSCLQALKKAVHSLNIKKTWYLDNNR